MVWIIAAIFAVNVLGGTTLLGLEKSQSEAINTSPATVMDIKSGGFTINEPGRQELVKQLSSSQGVCEITWSPDGMTAVYVRKSGAAGKAYIRKVGEKGERLLGSYPASAYGFFWAPDSRHVLLSEKTSNGALSRVIKADTMAEVAPRISSALIPVWSPDGRRLVAAGLERDKSGVWATIRVYTLGKKEADCLLKTPYAYGLYFIEYWDKEGTIGYSEPDGRGGRIARSLPAPQ